MRALAIILVLVVHTAKWFVDNQPPHTILQKFPSYLMMVGNIGVQLFIMISGALLLNRRYDLKDFFKRRFSRILILFIFWIIVAVIFQIFVLGKSSTLSSIIGRVFFKGYVWFIWVLLGLYLFVPVLNSFIREYDVKGCEFFLLFWFITVILNTIGIYPIENIELRYFSGFLGYMVLGWYLSNKQVKILSNKYMMVAGLLLFIIATLTSFYFVDNGLPFGTEYKVSLIPALQGLGLYLFVEYFDAYSKSDLKSTIGKFYSFLKDSFIGKIILSISLCSYGMYLTHYLQFGFLDFSQMSI